MIDGICIVDGIVAVNQWGENSTDLLTFPSDCQPSKQIAFSLNHAEKQVRVDVYPDGKVDVRAGGKMHGWMMIVGNALSDDLCTSYEVLDKFYWSINLFSNGVATSYIFSDRRYLHRRR